MIVKTRISVLYILGTIWVDFLIVLVLVFSVYMVKLYFHIDLPELPLGVPAFLGTAISILLSFKISQSYDRWWEARKIWGAIVNDSRSLVLQLQGFLQTEHAATIKTIAYRQIAWCYCLGQSLRELDPLEELEEYLSVGELEQLKKHKNKPLAIAQLNNQNVKELRRIEALDVFSQIQLDHTLVRLIASMGKAERIKSTVFPTTYRLNLHISIYVFLICLTITLINIPMFFGMALILIIGTIFFMLEGAAYNLQDPFENRPSDTAMTTIARTIEINIKELLQEEEVPEALPIKDFYLM